MPTFQSNLANLCEAPAAVVFSFLFSLELRAKIRGCVARGAVPDPDCPTDEASYKYWAFVGATAEEEDEEVHETHLSGNVQPNDVLQAMAVNNNVMATVRHADPTALARQAMANVPAASAPVLGAAGPMLSLEHALCASSCLFLLCKVLWPKLPNVEEVMLSRPQSLKQIHFQLWLWLEKLWVEKTKLLGPDLSDAASWATGTV